MRPKIGEGSGELVAAATGRTKLRAVPKGRDMREVEDEEREERRKRWRERKEKKKVARVCSGFKTRINTRLEFSVIKFRFSAKIDLCFRFRISELKN